MKQGTISVLIGCHSVVHSLLVVKAWVKLYNSFPAPWELICILIHDIGHWNTNYLDNLEEKKGHWKLGAILAYKLFGDKGYSLCAGHCEYSGCPQSQMYKADKLSQLGYPYIWSWWYQIFEPKIGMGYTKWEAYTRFQSQVKNSIETGEYRSSHDMYLERCKGKEAKP